MPKIALPLTILGATFALLGAVGSANAQATRTWVSGVGDDANPCSRTAPCKTFAGAISKTATGGEINCLDPGGFGAVTITKSITIDCHEVYASILAAGTNGIIINAAATSTVTLRNLNINGVRETATPGLNGIRILAAAAVFVEDLAIFGFSQNGINDERAAAGTKKLFVKDSKFRNNTGTGINLAAANANIVNVENAHVVGNGAGIVAAAGNFPTINNTQMSGNTGAGLQVAASSSAFVDRSVANSNGTGISNAGTIALANTDISFNSTGISGSSQSFGNNRIFGNNSAGPTPTLIGAASTESGQQ